MWKQKRITLFWKTKSFSLFLWKKIFINIICGKINYLHVYLNYCINKKSFEMVYFRIEKDDNYFHF